MHITDSPVNRTRVLEAAPAFGAFVCSLAAYASTASRFALGGDNGEFATLLATGGAAHPPGYPLFVLLLRALRWIPAASAAHAAALITAFVAAVATFTLMRACRAWGCSQATAAVVSAFYACSPLAWHLATHAEVFSLNALIAGVIVLLAAPTPPVRGLSRVGLLGLAAGLGLSNHHSIVLLAPLGLFGAWSAMRESKRPAASAAIGVGGLVAGLVPYLWLLGAANRSPWSWGDTGSLASLFFHMRRGEYGTTRLALSGLDPEPIPHLWAFARSLVAGLFGLPIVAALVAVFNALRPSSTPKHPDRASRLALAAAAIFAGPVFISRFNIHLAGVGIGVAERFYLLPMFLTAILSGLALNPLIGRLARRFRFAPWGIVLAAASLQTSQALPRIAVAHRPDVEAYARNVLVLAPPRAILVGDGDQRLGAFCYARYALGLRPDVEYIDARMLLAAWYRHRVSAAIGVPLPEPVERSLGIAKVTAVLLSTGRPVFFTDQVHPAPFEAFPSYPIGPLIRVLSPGSTVPDLVSLLEENLQVSKRLELAHDPPPQDSWGASLYEDYARPYLTLKGAFARAGDRPRFERCWSQVQALAPWLLDDAAKQRDSRSR